MGRHSPPASRPAPGERAERQPLWKRLLWMAAIWAASVAALGAVGWLIRLWIA